MSSESVIAARRLSKRYPIYARPQDRLKQSLFRGTRQYYREFWALRDVSFEVKRGEVVGIIGRNGSGKSTLLQLIAGTLAPTSGEVVVNGRVAALLELGSGFNPEFTGRENVFLNGAILGFSRDEIERAFVAIVDFADIGTFIDQPVKTYSSGMAVRLAFAVHAMMPKEILIVDETLAVGDELFQRKCFAKIEEFKAHGGTVLFVSHASGAVIQLCDRAFLMNLGELVLAGPSAPVVNLYHRYLYAPAARQDALLQEMRQLSAQWNGGAASATNTMTASRTAQVPAEAAQPADGVLRATFDPALVPASTVHYETRGADIFAAQLLTPDQQRVNMLIPKQRYVWQYRVRFDRDCEQVRCGMLIKTVSGLELGGVSVALPRLGISHVSAGTLLTVEFAFQANLAAGTYFLNAGVLGFVDGTEVFLDRKVDLGVFKILHDAGSLVTALVDFHVAAHIRQENFATDTPIPVAEQARDGG
jgi:homopolymeric O-antigen transport system ATP-binding protein